MTLKGMVAAFCKQTGICGYAAYYAEIGCGSNLFGYSRVDKNFHDYHSKTIFINFLILPLPKKVKYSAFTPSSPL